MSTPLVGIAMSIRADRAPEQALLNASYIEAVQSAGGLPVLLPPQLSPSALAALFDQLDGLLLTGGGDINPEWYDEPPHDSVRGVSTARDATEVAAIELARARALPLLAICRGMQMLNVALGGSLVQDIPTHVANAIAHAVPEPRYGPAHAVSVKPGSRLAGIVGGTDIEVNSRHHQSMRELGKGLEPVAWAPDGVIEGVELPHERFVVGVQWHPEDMIDEYDSARRLFAAFLAACGT